MIFNIAGIVGTIGGKKGNGGMDEEGVGIGERGRI